MKKTIWIALILTILLAIAGCGDDSGSKNFEGKDSSSDDSIDMCELLIDKRIEQELYFKNKEAKDTGVVLVVNNGGFFDNKFDDFSMKERLSQTIANVFNYRVLNPNKSKELADKLVDLQGMAEYSTSSSISKDGKTIVKVKIKYPDVKKLNKSVFERVKKQFIERLPKNVDKSFDGVQTLERLVYENGYNEINLSSVSDSDPIWQELNIKDGLQRHLVRTGNERVIHHYLIEPYIVDEIILNAYEDELKHVSFKETETYELIASMEKDGRICRVKDGSTSILTSLHNIIWGDLLEYIRDDAYLNTPSPIVLKNDEEIDTVSEKIVSVDGKDYRGYSNGKIDAAIVGIQEKNIQHSLSKRSVRYLEAPYIDGSKGDDLKYNLKMILVKFLINNSKDEAVKIKPSLLTEYGYDVDRPGVGIMSINIDSTEAAVPAKSKKVINAYIELGELQSFSFSEKFYKKYSLSVEFISPSGSSKIENIPLKIMNK